MSYADEKLRRQRELIARLHPGFPIEDEPSPGFDGGARTHQSRPDPTLGRIARAQRGVFGPYPNEDGEPGWPVQYRLENGFELLLPCTEPVAGI